MMTERLTGVSVFVEVVDAGSFAAAAQRLKVTRSAVGKSIARLEQRLGVSLFHRTTRRQNLSDDGQAYYERCVRALAELDAAEAEFDSGHREPVGRLRVTAPVLFGRHCVAPVLLELARTFPRIELEMSFSDRISDMAADGFDLAIRTGTLPDSDRLIARPLGTQRMAICASPAYLEKHGRPTSTEELSQHRCIVYGGPDYDKPWRLYGPDGGVQEAQITSKIRFDDVQAIADAAVAGAGLAWLPCWLIRKQVVAGELVLVMDSARVVSAEIHAVWPKTNRLASKTRVAIDALLEQIPPVLTPPTGCPTLSQVQTS